MWEGDGRRLGAAAAALLVLGATAARAGPPEISLRVGGRYDTSEVDTRDVIPRTDGPVVHTDLSAAYAPRIGSLSMPSSLEVYTDTLTRSSDEDYYSVSGWTGPSIDLPGAWSLWPAFGGRVSFYDGERLGLVADAYLTLYSPGGAFRYAELRAAYEDYRDEFEEFDAPVTALSLAFAAEQPPLWGDGLWLVPSVEHYRAQRAAVRYTQLAATLSWGGVIAGPLRLDLEVYGSRRFYADAEPGVAGDRRDWYLLAAAGLSLSPFLADSLSLEASYTFDQNWSNDPIERYVGHSAGLFLAWHY